MAHRNQMDWIRLWKRMAIYHRDGFDCLWCAGEFPPDPLGFGLSLDHVYDPFDNRPSNLATACRGCNTMRGRLTVDEWLMVLGSLGYDSEAAIVRVRAHLLFPLDKAMGMHLALLRRPKYSVGRKEKRAGVRANRLSRVRRKAC